MVRSALFDEAASAVPSARMRSDRRPIGWNRVRLLAATASLLLVAGALAADAAPRMIDPDLARVLRFMAILKGTFGVIALAASFWRLARPAAAWRTLVYAFGPGFIGAGAIGLWSLQATGLSTLVLHAGLFAMLGAALTDRDFLPSTKRSRSIAAER